MPARQPSPPDPSAPARGVPPPVTTGAAPLRLLVNPSAVAASRDRHPCSVPAEAARRPCGDCGWIAPEPADIPALLRGLPATWSSLLRTGDPTVIQDGACLRDEIHAVTNRIDQLLIAADSFLAPVRTTAPTALARLVAPRLLVALLEVAAFRLAALTDTIHGEQWDRRGRVRAGTVSVAELATLPLHRTHRHQSLATRASLRLVTYPRV